MEMYFLKSAACLAVLLLFYKLLLERENMHVFKRFYLLVAVVASIAIPAITFTTYIEPSSANFYQLLFSSEAVSETAPANYWTYILPGIYIMGIIFFGIKFIRNLRDLILKIKRNEKIKEKDITNVLLTEKTPPHTFFHYIFFNKIEYLQNEIPRDVKVHEEAHARQKHSFDVIFIELLQIIFWINPLIFILKNAIKLNHEFLADRAVIKQGYGTAGYQQTLLSYSSGDLQSDLVNPINYSSIKKRFTVMKTQTSRNAIWARSLFLLPLMAGLLYGFSNRAVEVKDSVEIPLILQDTIPDKKLTLYIEEESIIVNNRSTNLKDFAKTFNETTRDWTKEDFNHYGLEIQVADGVEKTFIDRINTEFRKTNMAKASGSNSPYIPQPRSLTSVDQEDSPATPKMENYLNDNSRIYLEGKIISTDEAVKLVKTRKKDLTVSILENGKNKPVITIEFKNPTETSKKLVTENQNLFMTAQAPPPPNSNTLEYVKELAKRGASFYIGPHKYSQKEVLQMVKKSTNEISIDVSQYPTVRLNGC